MSCVSTLNAAASVYASAAAAGDTAAGDAVAGDAAATSVHSERHRLLSGQKVQGLRLLRHRPGGQGQGAAGAAQDDGVHQLPRAQSG